MMTSGLGFTFGDRVELHPGTDAWMSGDKYGVVEKIGRQYVHVRMQRSGRLRKLHPDFVAVTETAADLIARLRREAGE